MAEFRQLTQDQLEEMVDGKRFKPRAIFFEKATLDVAASKERGRRIYKAVEFIQLFQPGLSDTIAYPAQEADKREYAREYQHFLNNRQGAVNKSIPISIIPSLTLVDGQELHDMGYESIDLLAAANRDDIPEHLVYAYNAAITLQSVLKENSHGKATESESVTGREGRDAAAPGGQEHRDHVRQPVPPESNPGRDIRETAERNDPGRQKHSGFGLNTGYNWSISTTFTKQSMWG